jgi:hypothetical protein
MKFTFLEKKLLHFRIQNVTENFQFFGLLYKSGVQILTAFILINSDYVQGQEVDSSIYYYKLANEAFRSRNIEIAEQYYTKSLHFKKHPDAYYNRAMVRKKMKSNIGYCTDLLEATKLGDKGAALEFWNMCGRIDTVYSKKKNKVTYEVRSNSSITNYLDCKNYNADNILLLHYLIDKDDTIYIAGKEIQNKKWDETLQTLSYLIPKRMNYPVDAIPHQTSGKITLDFTINKMGEIEDVHLLNGLPYGISNAALNAINSISNLGIQKVEGKAMKRKITMSMIVDFNAHVSLFKADMSLVENYADASIYQVVHYDLDSLEKATEYQYYKSGKQRAIVHYSDYLILEKEGSAIEYFESGQIKMDANYLNNNLHGNFNVFYENGANKRIEKYDEGKIVSSKCFDKNGKEEFCDEFEIMPEFPGGDVALFSFVAKEFKVQGPDRIEGSVWVYFRVGIDGAVKNVRIKKSLSPEYDNAALVMMSKMPKWKPGYLDGQAVEVQYILPIKSVIK